MPAGSGPEPTNRNLKSSSPVYLATCGKVGKLLCLLYRIPTLKESSMKKLCNLLLISGLSLGVHAQSVTPSTFNASGGSALLGGNTHEWSIGEMILVNTASTPNLIVTQGLLQPIIKDAASGVQDLALLQDVQVYPNPADQVLFVSSGQPANGTMYIVLSDIGGRTLQERSVKTASSQPYNLSFDVSALAAGAYALTLSFEAENRSEGTIRTTYKIQKTH
jgi:hypothetical protein